MHILFEQLKLVYVLYSVAPEPTPTVFSPFGATKANHESDYTPGEESRESSPEIDYITGQEPGVTLIQFRNDNAAARGYLLSQMNDDLFDIYVKQDSAKVIWESLSEKYGANGTESQSVRTVYNERSRKIKKFKGRCFTCRKQGHRAHQCYHHKGKTSKSQSDRAR